MDSLRLWARDGEAVRQAIELGEIAHMDTPGHNSRYISSESSRLTVTESQVRPSGEVRRAIIVGRNRGVAPGMSVPWGDRAPKLHAVVVAGGKWTIWQGKNEHFCHSVVTPMPFDHSLLGPTGGNVR